MSLQARTGLRIPPINMSICYPSLRLANFDKPVPMFANFYRLLPTLASVVVERAANRKNTAVQVCDEGVKYSHKYIHNYPNNHDSKWTVCYSVCPNSPLSAKTLRYLGLSGVSKPPLGVEG